jgi:tetratricopeptide (TPR) repeat protein
VARRLLIAGIAAASAAAILALGGLWHRSPAAASAGDVLPTAVAAQLQKGFAAGDTEAEIAGLQAELRANPTNVKALDTLGLAYEQRVRETGDATYYTKAEGILREALSLEPLSRHRFRLALALGRRAHAISPTTAGVYGVIGDAELELGRYAKAFEAFNRMAAMKPDVSSYARVSYARELLGHIPAAERAMALAASAAVGEREASSWTHTQLGLLYLGHGRPRLALDQLELAVDLDPTYYFALDGMAQVQASLGHLWEAIGYERRAVDRVPLPQQVGLLGDLYRAAGDRVDAQRQYALIGVIERVLAANGVKNDLDIGLFDADHGIALPHALELARKGYVDRPSIFGDDVLAWTLARNGQCRAALPYAERSLRLGTQDALKFFHRGWIASCLGDKRGAGVWYRRALALNPRFSVLWSTVAAKGARR